MANTDLKKIRDFIQMYGMEQDIRVDEYTNGPIPIEGLDDIKYMVIHRFFGPPWKTVYYCEKIEDLGDCVNRIIFDLAIEGKEVQNEVDV